MTEYYFTFQSLTMAQTGYSYLKNRGIAAVLKRTPAKMSEQGCGYSLVVGERTVRSAAASLAAMNIGYRRVFRFRDGSIEEVAL